MKKLIKIFIFVLLLFTTFYIFQINIKAKSDLDYIHLYEIKITPLKDGSLDMEYNISWEVLDSTSEGPLSWVKIGIPNYHAEEITALSSNIKKIKYYSDNGSYIRIDFKNKYYRGDVVNFSFKYNQSYMYHLYNDSVIYDYNPGWFDEIEVETCRLLWKIDGIKEILNDPQNRQENNGYYVWERSLSYGETINLRFRYNKSYFNTLDEKKQYTDEYMTPFDKIMMFLIILLVIIGIIAIIIFTKSKEDPYLRDRGFIRGYYHPYIYHRPVFIYSRVDSKGKKIVNPSTGSSSGYHGGSGCACACACACAGGGRAGCSKKDIYNTNFKSNMLLKVLKRKDK